jgi:hypothetical protein
MTGLLRCLEHTVSRKRLAQTVLDVIDQGVDDASMEQWILADSGLAYEQPPSRRIEHSAGFGSLIENGIRAGCGIGIQE